MGDTESNAVRANRYFDLIDSDRDYTRTSRGICDEQKEESQETMDEHERQPGFPSSSTTFYGSNGTME